MATEPKTRRRKRLVNIEASDPWIAWVDGLAEKIGANRATTIDQALRRLARSVAYETKPPKR